eukprot:TRINITY_DN7566_c0_g1_i1.p1 TRINITY_DN7566_c0_g1~~TRINITY_DN7566_c0_g1_i1.p1  ORF type:complete len:542 (-),score=120.69 TRINITY_DN7566_c0_g1_i1:138-1763(-)
MGNDSSRHITVSGYRCAIGHHLPRGDTTWSKPGCAVFSLLPQVEKGSISISTLSSGGFSLKRADKASVLGDKSSLREVIAERRALAEFAHNSPYIDHLYLAAQTEFEVYMVTELLDGGTIRSRLAKEKSFSEDRARYYAAQLVIALENIHKFKYVHRDVRPDNLLLDSKGHCVLSNFNHAAKISSGGSLIGPSRQSSTQLLEVPRRESSLSLSADRLNKRIELDKPKRELSSSTGDLKPRRTGKVSPTYEGSGWAPSSIPYMAPELLKEENYDFGTDWWSFGVCLYEMLTGKLPFKDTLSYTIDILPHQELLSAKAQDLITNLLKVDVKERLTDVNAIKGHAFFANLNWDAMEQRRLPAMWLPTKVVDDEPEEPFRPREDVSISEGDQLIFKHWNWDLTDLSSNQRKALSEEDLHKLFHEFSNPITGVHVADRTKLFRNYEQCWLGSEGVDWILSNVSKHIDGVCGMRRSDASGYINYWMRKGFIGSVDKNDEHPFFYDSEVFYVFKETPGEPVAEEEENEKDRLRPSHKDEESGHKFVLV